MMDDERVSEWKANRKNFNTTPLTHLWLMPRCSTES